MSSDSQPYLLSDSAMSAARYSTYENFQTPQSVGLSELKQWKQRVVQFQVNLEPAIAQGTLFTDIIPTTPDISQTLDPFSLRRQNTEFWRWQFDDVGVAAMYFVIDYTRQSKGEPLLLYIGETIKSNQRWKGEHDCKRYLLNYRQAHYDNGLKSELGIAFWPDAPTDRKARQSLESALIRRWRSPFNKENWRFWNTPFVDGKG